MTNTNRFEKVSFEEFSSAIKASILYRYWGEKYANDIYEQIKLPKRATSGSAGYDFFLPVSFSLRPGETIKIPTGIKCKLKPGRVLMIYPRSSLGFKYRLQLDNTVGVVDADYYNNASNEGHIYIKVTNDTKSRDSVLSVDAGDAIAQGIITTFDVTEDDDANTTRAGGIGSTSKP